LVLASLLSFIRGKYTWWPFEPLCFTSGLDVWIPWSVTFVPLIVWILKYVVIKVVGKKLYDEVRVAAAFGIITEDMLGIILMNAINMGRFVAFGA